MELTKRIPARDLGGEQNRGHDGLPLWLSPPSSRGSPVREHPTAVEEVAGLEELRSPIRKRPRKTRQRSLEQPICDKDDGSLFTERSASGALDGGEVAQFQRWIAASAHEPPPVAGAGAAKGLRSPDKDLAMFREQRLSYPPIFPQELTRPERKRSHSHENISTLAPHKAAKFIDEMIKKADPSIADKTINLPFIKKNAALAHKQEEMRQMLKECQRAEEVATSNQDPSSGRKTTTDESTNAASGPTVPVELFYEDNSFVPLATIDLSNWTTFCVDDSPVIGFITQQLSPSCTDLDLSGLTQLTKVTHFQELFEKCSKLRRLVLRRFENISKAAFVTIGRKCSLIEEIDVADSAFVTDEVVHTLLGGFPALKRIYFNGCARVTDQGVLLVGKKHGQQTKFIITHLSVDGCPYITDISLVPLLKTNGAKLRLLSIRGCHKISDQTIKELFVSQPKQLSELNISDCVDVTDAALEYLSTVPSYYGNRVATAYHQLFRLDISGCVALTSVCCSWIAASCPFLRVFRAARCPALCDKAIQALASLMQLQQIDLSGCRRISDRYYRCDGTSRPIELEQTKRLQVANLSDCPLVGEQTVIAFSQTASESLRQLELNHVGTIPATALVRLVRSCSHLTELRLAGQPNVTRAVLAHLASANKMLRLLDLRRCPQLDDLALYPLLLVTSLEELLLSESNSITRRGLQSLPQQLLRLELSCMGPQLDEDAWGVIASRLKKLERLDLTKSCGVTTGSLRAVVAACPHLYQLDVFGCSRAAQIGSLVPSKSPYGVELIQDGHFYGLSAPAPDDAMRCRQREQFAVRLTQRRNAASLLQHKFRRRAKVLWREQLALEQDWREFCAAVDIQRVYRGYAARCYYCKLRTSMTNAAVQLQYLWRKKLQARRVRRALGHWSNRLVLQLFTTWKETYEAARLERQRAKAAAKAARAFGHWGEKTTTRVFAAWRDLVRTKRTKAKKALGFWKCQSAPKLLEAWHECAQKERRHRKLLTGLFLNTVELETHNSTRQQELVRRANHLCKRVVIRLWQGFIIKQKKFLMKSMLSIVGGGVLHWAFRQWHTHVREQQQMRAKSRQIMAKVLHRDQYRAWQAWIAFMAGQRRARRALQRFSNNIQVKCWVHWRQYIDDLHHLRAATGRVGARLRLLQAARAVATWYAVAQELREAKQLARRALAFLINGTTMRVFRAWAERVARIKHLRTRMQAQMANANVAYAMTTWIHYTMEARYRKDMARRLQAFWRGEFTRRRVENMHFYRTWAVVLLQTAWRGRLARAILRMAQRKARLREYLRAERERDGLAREEALMRAYDHQIAMIVTLQRMFRGVEARHLYLEVRRARYLLKKQLEAEQQEIVRAEAARRKLERQKREKMRQLAAIEIQRHVRGFLVRKGYKSKLEYLHQTRCARRVQAVYRGRMARRRTAALRRSYLTRMEILTRRAVEGRLLRSLGAETRATQRPLRSFLNFFGLDPATFVTDMRVIWKEVREDFETLRTFFSIVRARVPSTSTPPLTAPPAPSAGGGKLAAIAHKSASAKKFLKDFEQLVEATAAEQEEQHHAVTAHDAVRIVLRGHPRCGETAFVLGVKDDVAQVKMDIDGAIEFFPLLTPGTKMEAPKRVLHCVPSLAFTCEFMTNVTGKISASWRASLEAYALSIEKEYKRNTAARVIQCAGRVYLARMRYQQELELQGVHAARRQQTLLRVLRTLGLTNTRIANILVQLHLVHPLSVPSGLTDHALGIQTVLDRFRRLRARRAEIRTELLRLKPEVFAGPGPFHGHVMPVPEFRVLDKLLHYPIKLIQKSAVLPMAHMLERQGLHNLAAFIGGRAFARTFEEKHLDAREFVFPQLERCGFCASEGWAVVHGVWLKRKVRVDRPAMRNSSTKPKLRTQLVPHGWGVAHFLAGRAGLSRTSRNWLERNSLEAQFKSLELVKALKQEEREERLQSQILARQGTFNALRSQEGPRGYAKRHGELSILEEKTKAFHARYEAELALRRREEARILAEEAKLNATVAVEKRELAAQGLHLHMLQQQVPEPVTDVALTPSTKSALEFLMPGTHLDVLYDDEVWYDCLVISIDPYDTCTAEVLYVDDQRKETLRLVDPSVLEETSATAGEPPKPVKKKSMAEINAAAAAKASQKEIPFRQWTAGKAVDVLWEAPADNGATLTKFLVEWRDEADATVKGVNELAPTQHWDPDRDVLVTDTHGKTTLWPILARCEATLRIRVTAENAKGAGLPSMYYDLPPELTDVSHRTARPLPRPVEDTSACERGERQLMRLADQHSVDFRRLLTCTQCQANCPNERAVHEHVARSHAVPLICPFKACRQPCASERALRYHIWRCSIPKPTPEEQDNVIFMEIFNLSRQYCMRKPRRHHLPAHTAFTEGSEEYYLEKKYQEAREAWFQEGKRMHEEHLATAATQRKREKANRYDPPAELYGVDFVVPDVNVSRREAVVQTIAILTDDLKSFQEETTTQLDKFHHEAKELENYIALKTKRIKNTEEEWQKQSLKREKKKALKSLEQVQEQTRALTESSTAKIEEMNAEIQRLTVIEKAFVPFIHQQVKTLRLQALVGKTHARSNALWRDHDVIRAHFHEDLRRLMLRMHAEVEGLEAWDAMLAARRKQLAALKDELRQLQLRHMAEMQGYRHKRDEGDEQFELKNFRSAQAGIKQRRNKAMAALAATKKGGKQAAAVSALEAEKAKGELDASTDLTTSMPSLNIANHDLLLHEKFLRGKDKDAEYMSDGFDGGDQAKGGFQTVKPPPPVVVAIPEDATSEDGVGSGQAAGEESGLVVTTSPRKKPKAAPKRLHELPHTYVRLECEFLDGLIHGHVRIEYNDGSVYEGPWVEDTTFDKPCDIEPTKTQFVPGHWGKFTYRDGTIWEGEGVDNFFSPFTATGKFLVTKPSGDQYEGDVLAGKYHGFGTYHMNFTFSKGEYVGEWCEGKRHGYGIERFDIGELYDGYWEMDLYHGHGEMVYDDGSRYEGLFRHGKWHGHGTRTLDTGDRIHGVFTDGFLNGPGIMEFVDKRHYHGAFVQTRRHGHGVLTYANGDRYEGPFENDVPHGEGKYVFKPQSNEVGAEPLVRIGRWVRGERTAWLSRPSSQLATATFIQYFAEQHHVNGETEVSLVPSRFKSPYAVMVAGLLPHLPDGVDATDPFVKSIVQMLAKTQNVMVGASILEKTVADHAVAKIKADNAQAAVEAFRNTVDQHEREYRAQARKVTDLKTEYDQCLEKEQEMQVKVENFWRRDTQNLEQAYKDAVEQLHRVESGDWYRLRTANLDQVYMSLLEAFCVLLNFTSNFYLRGTPYVPTRDDVIMMLSNNDENVAMGDKEGLIHKYTVKALYVLPLFDIYSFADGARNSMLLSVMHVVHHPRLRPNNFRLYQISPAATAVCTWVRAAYFYAKKACEIKPVVQRVLDQLVIVEHLRTSWETEKQVLKEKQDAMHAVQEQMRELQATANDCVGEATRLRQIIDDIEALDKAEHVPMEKQHIKKPTTLRPPSAGPTASEGDATDGAGAAAAGGDKGATTDESKPSTTLPEESVNHRQTFEEDHAESVKPKQMKEQVLERILENEELSNEFAILKKEVTKVLDRCGGKVAMELFPDKFEEIMHKPLDPLVYGVKKLRKLLALMEDVCSIFPPQKEGDLECVGFPVNDDDDQLMPRKAFFCRLCPGVSYDTKDELLVHEKTKWHWWNMQAKAEGREPNRFTLAATYWTEVYDSTDGAICYYNSLTGEAVKDEMPMEMQANDIVLELLGSVSEPMAYEEPAAPEGNELDANAGANGGEDPWEEVADDSGNVYFYNRVTGETSWTHPDIYGTIPDYTADPYAYAYTYDDGSGATEYGGEIPASAYDGIQDSTPS
ncbi:TPA: hypothetical protein N0F65_002137 [Lagenidium giganteum]|uniref:Uncharacterized protein n=1 Tax=Lagenidium giganteum TaxID=4803 RepID=A0AAV2ZEJ8_9STRA|nr:TPA: hypothetical protein N0F65_002137 [Lagenidium giganteum]